MKVISKFILIIISCTNSDIVKYNKTLSCMCSGLDVKVRINGIKYFNYLDIDHSSLLGVIEITNNSKEIQSIDANKISIVIGDRKSLLRIDKLVTTLFPVKDYYPKEFLAVEVYFEYDSNLKNEILSNAEMLLICE